MIMKKKNILNLICGAACLLGLATSCSVDPEFYSQVVPDTFYSSQNAVWQRFSRPFTHWRWWVGHNDTRFALQELGTDEFIVPTRGSDWFDGATYQRFHHHEYTFDMTRVAEGFRLPTMGVALAWDALEDLSEVDFDALGFPSGTRESMLAQQTALVASFYLDGLDLFGGMPLYESTHEEVKGRATAQETFDFVEKLLNECIPNLPKKTTVGAQENGSINQAAGAMLKARLYFNAKAYIGKEMYNEAAQVAQDVINGVYGAYDLDDKYQDTFGFFNDRSKEVIWSVPSENAKLQTDGTKWAWSMPYRYFQYLGNLEGSGGNNGLSLVPGLDPKGNRYDYKLGGVYQRFNDQDIRKKNYVYYDNGVYEGIFLVGKLVNPLDESKVVTGTREYRDQIINIVDQCARFSEVGSKYASIDDLDSNIGTAEENSCVRLIKITPRPDQSNVKMMYNPDYVFIRLTEAYYMLAECKWRNGDKQGACDLINKVRARAFEGADPDPVTPENLDKYRFLNEWSIEFLGEARRRTDLIRWDAYVTEDWWDHKATNNHNLERFPLHNSILASNPLLEQNPGY